MKILMSIVIYERQKRKDLVPRVSRLKSPRRLHKRLSLFHPQLHRWILDPNRANCYHGNERTGLILPIC
jgi:hypothetical protein